MRILFLSQLLPYPLDAGAKIRAYFTLRHLASRHEVTLLAFTRAADTDQAAAHLREVCAGVRTVPIERTVWAEAWHGARSLVNGEPFLISRDRRAAMLRAIDEALAEAGPFDAVHADQLWMAPYAEYARERSPNRESVKTVLDQHNAVFQIPRRMAADEPNRIKRGLLGFESRKMARYEVKTCAAFDHVVYVTAEDRAALHSHGLSADENRETVIPICLEPPAPATNERAAGPLAAFVGGLNWPPNAEGVEWFLDEIWPRATARVAGARFRAVGKLPESWRGRRTPNSVELTGYLPSTDAALEDAAVFVVPLRSGGGMRVKILDAWSRGLPVVSTTIGAEGLDLRPGENILLADEPEAFADAVVRVMEDGELAARLRGEGRRTVEISYDWRRGYAAWDRVYSCASSS